VLATAGDLGRPRDVIRLAEELTSKDTGLPPTRIVNIHISTARTHLDLVTGMAHKARWCRHGTSLPRRQRSTP
jgi:hypothetical protein